MGYASYTLPDGRKAGYAVQAECDHPGCAEQINRGFGYLCGESPDGWRGDDEPGCGQYFCETHLHGHSCPNPAWDSAYLESIARVAHEANRAIQSVTGDPAVSPPWDEAPDWQCESAIDGVKKALEGATPEELHESWCEFKRADGWVYGTVKDPRAKTHPCLVPYDELPAEQRLKDEVFAAIVAALA